MGLDESYQSRRLRWDICFDQNAARNIQDTNSGLLERDVQCNVLIHDRSPGNKPQRQTWWHPSRAESGRADYPMCENLDALRTNRIFAQFWAVSGDQKPTNRKKF